MPADVNKDRIVQVEANSKKIFEFGYCCATDKYKINGKEESKWTKYTSEADNFFRKLEHDWKKVYLRRTDKEKREIEWKFNVPQNSKIEKIQIVVNSAEFKTGRVLWVSLTLSSACYIRVQLNEKITLLCCQFFRLSNLSAPLQKS